MNLFVPSFIVTKRFIEATVVRHPFLKLGVSIAPVPTAADKKFHPGVLEARGSTA